jgi:hypothetical protein
MQLIRYHLGGINPKLLVQWSDAFNGLKIKTRLAWLHRDWQLGPWINVILSNQPKLLATTRPAIDTNASG